jgi:predicted methyltransferase
MQGQRCRQCTAPTPAETDVMRMPKPLLILCLFAAVAAPAAADPVAAALADPGRTDADRQRDVSSRPQDTLALLAVKPGDRVIDLFAGGGYYSEILARVVGADGAVTAYNNPPYTAFTGTELAGRMKEDRLPNLSIYEAPVADFAPAPARFDSALMIMSYHDLYWVSEAYKWPAMDAGAFLDRVHVALRPGGRVLVVDHSAPQGSGTDGVMKWHRIEEAHAIAEFARHGFRVVAQSDVLRNADDPRDIPMGAESVRGRTDRFVLVFERD